MGDFKGGLAAIRREGDQPLAGVSKALENGHHFVRRFPGCHDLRKLGATPRVFDPFAELHHREESPPHQVFLARFREVVCEPVRFRRQCAADAAELAQRIGPRRSLRQAFPDPMQSEFQKRQRAGPPDGLLYEKLDGALIERVGYSELAPLPAPPEARSPPSVRPRSLQAPAREGERASTPMIPAGPTVPPSPKRL